MKSCGLFIRILAIVAAILLCTFSILNYSLDSEYYDEQRDELAEEMDEHEEEHAAEDYLGYSDEDDECYQCESYEKQEKNLDRYEKELLYGLIQQCVLYAFVWCGVLFILGEIASKVARSKKEPQEAVAAPAPAPVIAPAPVPPTCPKCGAPKQPGSRFCGTCGTFVDQP